MTTPWIEITTRIGCANNCVYCPQKTLVKRYSAQGGEAVLSLDRFQTVLDRLPPYVAVHFSGFTEPFENPQAVEMVLEAGRQNRQVAVYTTLRGLSLEQIDQLSSVPFIDFIVHVPDSDGAMHQTVDDLYLAKLRRVQERNISKLRFMVIGEPDVRAAELLGPKLHREAMVILRGANLAADQVPDNIRCQKIEAPQRDLAQPIICQRTILWQYPGQTFDRPMKTECPVLLPDGTLVLCCMDYGLQHVLGNLLTQSWQEIFDGSAMKDIETAMARQPGCAQPLLCNRCEWSVAFDPVRWRNFSRTGHYDSRFQSWRRFLFQRIKTNSCDSYISEVRILGLSIIKEQLDFHTKKQTISFLGLRIL